MNNFLFSIYVTIPIFLVMVVGYFLRWIHILNDEFVSICNKFNFTVTLPVVVNSTVEKIANIAIPLVLITLGAFDYAVIGHLDCLDLHPVVDLAL